MKSESHPLAKYLVPICVLLFVSIAAAGFFGWQYYTTSHDLAAAKSDMASSTASFESVIGSLESRLLAAQDELASTSAALQDEQGRNNAFADQISGIASTVSTLDKLSKTDPELLKKYSKVYFLNENYVPSSLSAIDKQYLSDPSRKLQFHTEALAYLQNMLADAKDDASTTIQVLSAYRSFSEQSALKAEYKVTYGSGANAFSADQGYSEHQLGTTIDFTTPGLGGGLTGFEKTSAYQWLLDNAYRYGFIISYPAKNAYYEFEPWHWRFVGVDLAKELHNRKLNFYDMDQREIDTYLISLFN